MICVPNTSLDPEEVRKQPLICYEWPPMTNKDALFTSARTGEINRDEWMTPLWLYEKLDHGFKFDLDPAATAENTLAEKYYDKEWSGLTNEWFGSVYVNPPYSQLKKWVKKGFEEANNNPHVKSVVMLVPARTDTQAWWEYIRHGEVRFLPGRLKFRLSDADKEIVAAKNLARAAEGRPLLDPEGTSAPFPSAVVVFYGGGYLYKPETIYWNIREPKYAI